MNCEKIMKQYLEHDHTRPLPLKVRVHFMFCKKCRREAELLMDSISGINGTAPFHLNENITDSIMLGILLTGRSYSRHVRTSHWVIAGAVILSSIFMVSYSSSANWISCHFGRSFELPLHLVLGLSISAYVSLFIGSLVVSYRVKGESNNGHKGM